MSATFFQLICLAAAGALGTLGRYGMGVFVKNYITPDIPWSTFAVNIMGCFLFGFVLQISKEVYHMHENIQVIILIGFMGAFTTFSTYIFEIALQAEAGKYIALIANIAGQNLFGWMALFLGIRATKAVCSLFELSIQ